ncbi:unnamed protein product [Sphagnum jensenii]|uniref:Uncharacterized protein n=2 Tax=Sphagnum jensenii TaxID=128206 RepID=A0ABP1B7E2_9BRYO
MGWVFSSSLLQHQISSNPHQNWIDLRGSRRQQQQALRQQRWRNRSEGSSRATQDREALIIERSVKGALGQCLRLMATLQVVEGSILPNINP